MIKDYTSEATICYLNFVGYVDSAKCAASERARSGGPREAHGRATAPGHLYCEMPGSQLEVGK